MTSAQHISRTRQFHTTVRDTTSLSAHMRRITVAAPDLRDQLWPLGCDIAIVLTGEGGREVRRRYTVRSAEADFLVVDAVLHGDGAGSDWAAQAQPGDDVIFFGPRGQLPASPAGSVVAVTDESGLPAVAAMLETTNQPVRVLAEIADQDEQYPLPSNADVTWLPRDGKPPGAADTMVAAIQDLTEKYVFAYAIAESRAVLRVRDALEERGVARSAIYFKGYWNLKSRPAR